MLWHVGHAQKGILFQQGLATCGPRASTITSSALHPQPIARTTPLLRPLIPEGLHTRFNLGLDRRQELIASSWHCPPFSHFARLLSVIVKYCCRFAKFLLFACRVSPSSPFNVLPSSVSALCNSAFQLKRLPNPALRPCFVHPHS